MKKPSRVLALVLVFEMVMSLLSVMSFGTEEGEQARQIEGLPSDGSYGVVCYCGETPAAVLGADISDGVAPVRTVRLSPDGKTIAFLPAGAAVFRFIKNEDGTYYLKLGSAYLAIRCVNSRSEIVLQNSTSGAKWDLVPDAEGACTVSGHEVPGSDRYLRYCNNRISPNQMTADRSQFRFRFFASSPDGDGRIGDPMADGSRPGNGAKVVIYNHSAKAVFGQPTGADKQPALLPAAADLGEDGSLDYEKVADGGLIFNVRVEGIGSEAEYLFETNGRYLAMSENFADETGGVHNAEALSLIEMPEDAEKQAYARWTLGETAGGYILYNAAAMNGERKCCAAFLGAVFKGWTPRTDDPAPFSMRFLSMQDKDGQGYVVNPRVLLDAPDPAIGEDCPVRFVLDDLAEPVSVRAEYTCSGAGTTGPQGVPEVTLEGKRGGFTVPAADLAGWDALTIRITVKNALGKAYEAVKVCEIRNEPVIISATPAADSATGAVIRPEIAVTYANVGEGSSFEMLVDGRSVPAVAEAGKFSYLPDRDMTEGRHAVCVTVTRADGKQAERRWHFFVGEGGARLFFGQIHAHTASYSDGVGTLEEAYEHAHGAEDMDFLIVTDHSNFFDTTATATASSYYDLRSLLQNGEGSATRWEEARAIAREYNERYEDFLCVYGYEMTWSGGPGHINTYNTYGVVSRNNGELNNKTANAGMYRYYDLMANAERGLDIGGRKAVAIRDGRTATGVNATKYIPFDAEGNPVPVVSQFNHPGRTYGDFESFAGRTAERDDVLNLIEVGNGEGAVGSCAYISSYAEYDRCLSMGWHVGPTNNQDNHRGGWGSSNTCRDVILTDDFSEIGLYRALDQRRIYATEDQNLRIFYDLIANGVTYRLGDIASIEDSEQPASVTVRLDITDPDREDKIAFVEVVGEGGRTLNRVEVNDPACCCELELPNTDAYYYIRVTEQDGQIAVTSPVWVREAVPVTAAIKTSASMAVQGEQETVTATLHNGSEDSLLYVRGYRVEAEGRVLAERTGLEAFIRPNEEMELKLPFTPASSEPAVSQTYEIKATFFAAFEGTELTRAGTLTETSYAPEQMTFIGLDNGHRNFCVSGDYAGSESTFLEICAARGILCQYIEAGKMTRENLAKYKAVILTVPRVDENTRPPVWTAEELEAVADYAAHGGCVINLSKSDRYDYAGLADGVDRDEYASAALSNLINEAVGAQTRFVRGIVVDNEHKTNEAYRISFEGGELVGDHPFTAGICAASNGAYRWYNGTGIIADPCLRFADIKRSSYYHKAVDYMLEHGLMSGLSQTAFGPKTALTREMLVTILWQIAGRPTATGPNPFSDVRISNYSYKAILWAYENGIASGRSKTTFARKAAVTRQELAVFLYSFARYKRMDLGGAADLSSYPDAGTVSAFAGKAMRWAVANGLMSGVKIGGVTYLSPRTSSDRGQVALVLKQFIDLTGEDLPRASGAVTTLIAPYPGTWVASYQADFTGSAYVPDYEDDRVLAQKGSFSLVTVEKLPGGGFLVCGGACFFTNSDLKYGVPAEEQYENYGLVCNILDTVKQKNTPGP